MLDSAIDEQWQHTIKRFQKTADETTNVSTIFQLALIYRYMVGGKPVERFWSFLKLVGHDAESLAECLKSELDYHVKNDPHKLIALH
ncbi:hypothetical protein NQ318_020496 [Aromia moschata]|uniref:Uncharacterized protein n=1 Tax=Aromia moschata TaxID=1265417 RepID=A0AAV8YBR8_9CUCU|nr:hypothetical protein NQ318_020496 [Aromia moschata]